MYLTSITLYSSIIIRTSGNLLRLWLGSGCSFSLSPGEQVFHQPLLSNTPTLDLVLIKKPVGLPPDNYVHCQKSQKKAAGAIMLRRPEN